MVHIRSREQMRGDPRLPQTMPADLGQTFVRTSHPGVRIPSAPQSESLACMLRLRSWAIEAAHPWLALICEGSRARGGIVYLLRSPETHRRIQHPMRPKLQSFRTGGER